MKSKVSKLLLNMCRFCNSTNSIHRTFCVCWWYALPWAQRMDYNCRFCLLGNSSTALESSGPRARATVIPSGLLYFMPTLLVSIFSLNCCPSCSVSLVSFHLCCWWSVALMVMCPPVVCICIQEKCGTDGDVPTCSLHMHTREVWHWWWCAHL